jgi:hypothetical protein
MFASSLFGLWLVLVVFPLFRGYHTPHCGPCSHHVLLLIVPVVAASCGPHHHCAQHVLVLSWHPSHPSYGSWCPNDNGWWWALSCCLLSSQWLWCWWPCWSLGVVFLLGGRCKGNLTIRAKSSILARENQS